MNHLIRERRIHDRPGLTVAQLIADLERKEATLVWRAFCLIEGCEWWSEASTDDEHLSEVEAEHKRVVHSVSELPR
jgi:hypothetical protein